LLILEVRGIEIRVHDIGSLMAESWTYLSGVSSVTSPSYFA